MTAGAIQISLGLVLETSSYADMTCGSQGIKGDKTHNPFDHSNNATGILHPEMYVTGPTGSSPARRRHLLSVYSSHSVYIFNDHRRGWQGAATAPALLSSEASGGDCPPALLSSDGRFSGPAVAALARLCLGRFTAPALPLCLLPWLSRAAPPAPTINTDGAVEGLYTRSLTGQQCGVIPATGTF